LTIDSILIKLKICLKLGIIFENH